MSDQSSDSLTSGNYRLVVKNFGPIEKADVELRPLTIFVGPSNTGKSYLAILIYALNKSFFYEEDRILGSNPQRLMSPQLIPYVKDSPALWKMMENWFSRFSPDKQLASLPTELATLVQSNLERPHGLNELTALQIARCFSIEKLSDLHRRSINLDNISADLKTSVNILISTNKNVDAVSYMLKLTENNVDIYGVLNDNLTQLLEKGIHDFLSSFNRMNNLQDLEKRPELIKSYYEYPFHLLIRHFFHSFLEPLSAKVHYLPASRTGIIQAHNVVVSALLQNATRAGLKQSTNIPLLSGVLADFLDQLINVGNEGRRRQHESMLARSIETNVLQGAVEIEESKIGYPTFSYRPKGWKNDLPLMRASSMVTELAPVVLYLRHVVRKGDVLIIEEPEAHLHPGMQAALARELARMVHSGVRIVMTTHSEWLLEQIGNLVNLSSLDKDKREGITGADVALKPSDVGAWLFKPSNQKRGVMVEEVKLDDDTGLFPTDYDSVSQALYNDSAMIFNRKQ